jgi:hypothetical protein
MSEIFRGSVTDQPWGRTLAWFGHNLMSGQLTVYCDNREYAIVFSQGAVVGAFSPLPADSVARVALTAGLLTGAQVTEVARRQSHDDGTDSVIEVARLTPDQAARLRRRAAAHRAARTFSLERGDFVFTDTVTAGWHPDAAVDVRAVVYFGARQSLSESRLASDLGLLGASFRLREDSVADLPQYGFSDLEAPMFSILRRGASLLAVENSVDGLDQRTLRAAIYALACGGAVDAIGELHNPPAGPPVRPSHSSIPQPPSSSEPPASARTRTGAPTSPASARTRTGDPTAPTSARTRTGAPSAETASRAQVGNPADFAVARTTTPLPAAQPPRAPTKPPPLHPSSSRTVVAGAARNASTSPPTQPSRTATPSRTSSPSSRAPTPLDPPRTTTPPPPRRTVPPAVGAVPAPLSRDGKSTSGLRQLPGADVRVPTAMGAPPAKNPLAVSEIQSLIKAKISLVDQGADHFLLLGVTPDAPIEVIRSAFYGVVRRIHPDALVSVGLPVTDQAQRLAARFNDAYAVLNDPEKRREYEAGLPRSGAHGQSAEALVSAVLSAEERFRRGQAALRRDDLEEAAREFEAAFELKKDEGDYLALATWARFCAAPDKEAVAAQARQTLERAARLSPESVTPRFWHGRLERTLGRTQQALVHFRWVVDQDPRHAEASAEIRILMSREPQGRGGSKPKR